MSAAQKCNSVETLGPNGIVLKNTCRTKIKVDKLHYVWTIDHYSFHHSKKEVLKTPIFTANSNHKCRWYLYLQRNDGTDPDDKDDMDIYLCLDCDSECKNVYAKYKFSILDKGLKKRHIRSSDEADEFSAHEGGDNWGFPSFVMNNFLSDEKLLPNDKLTIYCEVTFSDVKGFIETLNNSNSIQVQPDAPKCCISNDFGSLLKNQELTDVTLSVNGNDYKAHKIILAARSPVFAAMFKHNTKENETNRVDIIDIDEKVIEELLRYIYTDKCENLKHLADALLAAAEKYNLQGLKTMCQKVLIMNLSIENAANTLNTANLYCAHELKSKTISFIVANSIEVMNSIAWKSAAPLYPASLMMEVCAALSRQAAISFI